MKGTSGILLIEAFLSIIILGTAASTVTRSFSYASQVYRSSGNYLTAVQLIDDKMAEIEALPELTTGEAFGTFESPYKDFKWSLSTLNLSSSHALEEDESSVEYVRVTLKVSWKIPKREEISVEALMIKKKENEDESPDSQEAL